MPARQPITIQIERKTFSFEVKSIDEAQGIIKGYLSVFNNIDSQKDRVRPGAFKKTISDGLQRKSGKGKKFLWPLLWMHDPEKPIGGFIDAIEDKVGLLVTAQLDISTNDKGIPLNPLATSVFSGFKLGYIDELSIGYKAIQKAYDSQGIRDLTELQLFEGSAVTMLFAANEDAQVSSVKRASMTYETKAADLPLAPKGTVWSKGQAMKDIEAESGGDWGKAAKYFFYSAPNPTTEADLKFPFAAKVDGSMKAVPRAIFNAAARLESAKGVDVASIKPKIAAYYSKMGLTPPWSSKGKSRMAGNMETKDFNDRYREEQIKDWKTTDFQNLVCALQSAIMDIFAIGDEPEADMLNTILNGVDNGSDDPGNKVGFIEALQDYVQKGIDLDVASYIDDNSYFGNVYGGSSYGYMTALMDDLETKKGAAVSKESAARLSGHADTLELAHKAIATVADDMRRYITGGAAPYGDSGTGDGSDVAKDTQKSRQQRPHNAPHTNDQPLTSTDMDISDADLIEALQHAHF